VVGSATALTAIMARLERHHLALGASMPGAFETAFSAIFFHAGSALAVLFALGALQLRRSRR